MEAIGAICDGLWSSLGGLYVSDEADLMAQLLGKCTFSSKNEGDLVLGIPSSSWTSHGSGSNLSVMSGSALSSSGFSDPYSSSYGSRTDVLLSGSSDPGSYNNLNCSDPVSARNSGSVSVDYCLSRYSNEGNVESSDSTMKEPSFRETWSPLDQLHCSQVLGMEFLPSGHDVLGSGVLGKRSRSPDDLHGSMGTARSKVARRLDFSSNNEEEANATPPSGPSSSACHSEDDSNGRATCSSLSLKGSTLNTNSLTPSPSRKTRASRGSATDPQSLYARKRREKINERLRILQSLVPNGTKVDISTMLEEAVHYVKFLQLQIKLLSSDELWMYAPIAYNGMDIGLNKFARGRQS